ncbi:MAG TPA: tetratricopeptide repeat protein, partial [Pyrinomonadaceae bacterium]|nr:tetratricopeptide repeat protein [Pyrinomonadaceae bacterium]
VIDVKTIADDVLSVVSELDKTLSKSASFNLKILRPNGTAEIIVPPNVEAEKLITLTAGLDENLKKLKDSKLVWQDLSEASALKTGNSYSFTLKENESKNVRLMVYAKLNGIDTKVAQDEKTITVGKKDKTPTPTPTPTPETFDSTKLRFGGTMPDIWAGGSNDRGFEVSRQFAKMSGTGDCAADHWAATVQGKVYGQIGPSFVYNEKDIQTEITNFVDYSKAWGRTSEVRDFAIGDFKGKFVDTSLNFSRGTGGMFGYTNDSVKAEGRGWIIKEKQVVAIGYLVTGNGCHDNHDQAFLMSQGRAAQAEAKAIVNSLTLIGGTFAKTPYKGPKLDGSDMPRLKLVVSPDLKKLKKGDVVNVQAVIENEENAEKPLQFDWTGDHAGSGASVKFLANKPGKQSLSVNVPGVGSAAVEFEVANLKAEIKLVTPQTKVAVGVPVAFTAQLLSDGSPLTGNYIYRFQPSPEVKFDTNESAKQQTNAIFAKPGREKVWVQILERKDQVLETVAESDQIEIEIVAPELKITFDQDKALVGKAVKAKVEVVPPDLKNIDFRWEIPANARQTLQSPDAKEVTFIPQNANPITIKVNARVPVSGEDLGAKEATITAQKYDVRVNVLGAEGPKPQVWKEGVGLVTVENGIAIHQFVGLRAEVSPLPENPRFEWTLNEDSHFAGNNITQQVRVSRSQTGTCEATVIVRDKDGIELGRGNGTFNVSISQMELDKAKTMGGTNGKLTQAKDIIKKGQLDEAIKLVDEVLKASPKNTEAATLSKKWKKDRTTITTQLAKVRSLIDKQMFPEASNELIVAKNLHNLYPPVLEIEKELNDKWGKHDSGLNLAVGEVRLANEARNFKKALELAKEIRAKYRLMSGTEQTLKNYEDWATTHEAEKNRQRAILQQGEAKFNAYDYEGAIKDFDVMWGNNHYEYWSIYEPEPKKYGDLRNEAFTRLKRINELMPLVGQVVDNPNFNKTMIQTALKNVDEVLQLQPTNAKAQEYKTTLTERLGRGEKGMQYEQAIKKGNEYSDAQNYGEAIKEYDKAIKSDGKSAEAYRLRGRAKRANGDLKGALKDFDKSLELNPNNSKTFVGRGLVREKIPDLNGALSDYSRAIELDPNYTAAYSNRGGLRIDINDFQGAITDFDKVISLDPKNTSAYINRGVAKTRLENYSEALKDYNKAIELDSTISLTYNNRGYTKEKLNDLKGALSDYEKAVALDPNSETAKSRLEKLKEKMQSNQVAVKPSPTPLPTPTAKPTPKPTPTNIPAGKEVEIFNNMNIYGVQNKPTALTKFTITKPHVITYIFTYHWNNASGNRTVGFIGIYNERGERFGPWQATGTAGQGGVLNANWEVYPNIIIPAGTYTIVVSQEETWSQNSQSGGRGMSIVKGYPTSGVTPPTPTTKPSNTPTTTPKPTPTTPKQGAVVVAVIQNRSSEPTHIFAEGDNFGPQNKIAPGASKEVSVRMTADGRIKFFAGRNGQVITSKIWTGDPSDMNRYPKVIFDGSQLIITTGLR